jgi:hypothetical protein
MHNPTHTPTPWKLNGDTLALTNNDRKAVQKL